MNSETSFLIVGAGPLGLAMAKALREAGVPHAHVEATDHVGGNWAHGVYETAHIISSKSTTEYPDYPMPEHYPDFPSAAQMCAYFNAFADDHDLRRHIRFETRLDHCVPERDLWRCTFSDGTTERYKGVLVCNGHHWKRRYPAWASEFAGELMHSKDYKRPGQLTGKRILVVGAGNSGCDLASEAARVGAHADWSMRRGTWFMPKHFLGRPSIEFVHPWIPVPVQRVLVRTMFRAVVGRFEDYGLPRPDDRPFDRHPTVNSEVFHYLQHGELTARPGVAAVDGHTIQFVDGSSETYDLLVCATGFDVAFPFLPAGLVDVKGKTAQLIGGSLVPGYKNLFVCGTTQPRYGLGPLVRPYAQLIAHWATLQDELEVPLADVLYELGQRPPPSEVMDPHAGIRMLKRARMMDPVIRRTAKRMVRRAELRPRPA